MFYMHHKLDNHPISSHAIYVNDLRFANDVPYESEAELEKAITGKIKTEGGIIPDDNVRIYVPMDLNADAIMHQLYMLYDALGPVDEGNEFHYSSGLARIILQLEVYDQAWIARETGKDNQAFSAIGHSLRGIMLAKQLVKYLKANEGVAECFPYEEIEELKEKFDL